MVQKNYVQCIKGNMSVPERVRLLLTEGSDTACDSTCTQFKKSDLLPLFYDEGKFERGQRFFRTHIFSMLFGKLLGLLSILAIPTVLKVLMFTKMSSEPLTAYKRYMATIFHMCVWYDSDFKPGSQLWESIYKVKNMHNTASKRSCAGGLNRISQKDMVLTQFGFMGFILVRPTMVGIHNASKEDMEAFVHVWRVVGYLMGIEDRFNLCSGSLEETKQYCESIIKTVLRPAVEEQDSNFLKMSDALVCGMWVFNPFLETKVFLTYLYKVLNCGIHSEKQNKIAEIELTFIQRAHLFAMVAYTWMLRFWIIRLHGNFLQNLALWLMLHCPFLAYFNYGYSNSHVSIGTRESKAA